MSLDIVLNDVSLIDAAYDIPTARHLMSDLFKTITAASMLVGRRNTKIEVCTPRNLLALPLVPHKYTVVSCCNDKTVDEPQRLLFLKIATNTPYIDDVDEDLGEEFLFQGQPVTSLGHASKNGSLAVSLRSKDYWDNNRLQLEHRYAVRGSNEIINDLVDVIHASRPAHVQEHSSWIRSSLQVEALSSISDGAALWEHREKFFPNLLFCVEVEDHLQQILRGSPMLKRVIRHLSELERYCKNWNTGGFDKTQLNCTVSRETKRTLQEYKDERTFHSPDNEEVIFNWHVKFHWRIYFEPLEDKKQMLVGYIGLHLHTAKYSG